jgi:hypothetical protein
MSFYDPNARYLHGSKQQLQGDNLTRSGKNGRYDSGALFFCKDTPAGRWYVGNYGQHILNCQINIPTDQVFDFTNPTHRQKLQQRLSLFLPQEWQRLQGFVCSNGHLYWTALERTYPFSPSGIDEDLFKGLGFRGIVLVERIAGEQGAPEDILSIAAFDPADVEVLGIVEKIRDELF